MIATKVYDDIALTPEELSELLSDLPIILDILINEKEAVSKFSSCTNG